MVWVAGFVDFGIGRAVEVWSVAGVVGGLLLLPGFPSLGLAIGENLILAGRLRLRPKRLLISFGVAGNGVVGWRLPVAGAVLPTANVVDWARLIALEVEVAGVTDAEEEGGTYWGITIGRADCKTIGEPVNCISLAAAAICSPAVCWVAAWNCC